MHLLSIKYILSAFIIFTIFIVLFIAVNNTNAAPFKVHCDYTIAYEGNREFSLTWSHCLTGFPAGLLLRYSGNGQFSGFTTISTEDGSTTFTIPPEFGESITIFISYSVLDEISTLYNIDPPATPTPIPTLTPTPVPCSGHISPSTTSLPLGDSVTFTWIVTAGAPTSYSWVYTADTLSSLSVNNIQTFTVQADSEGIGGVRVDVSCSNTLISAYDVEYFDISSSVITVPIPSIGVIASTCNNTTGEVKFTWSDTSSSFTHNDITYSDRIYEYIAEEPIGETFSGSSPNNEISFGLNNISGTYVLQIRARYTGGGGFVYGVYTSASCVLIMGSTPTPVPPIPCSGDISPGISSLTVGTSQTFIWGSTTGTPTLYSWVYTSDTLFSESASTDSEFTIQPHSTGTARVSVVVQCSCSVAISRFIEFDIN